MGWVFNEARDAWELMSRTGMVVQAIGTGFLAQFGPAPLNRYGARRGWPVLVPGAAWVHCVLDGGPMDGRHVFYDPAVFSAPPEELTCAAEPPPKVAGSAPRLVVYRRQMRTRCVHGAGCVACPFPYRWDPAV